MGSSFRHGAHLIRLGVVVLIFVGLFAVLREHMVPETFGEFGHYRGAALAELRAAEPVFAGQDACAACHDEAVTAKSKGKHARIACEACHGPQARHAAEGSPKPARPDSIQLCGRCHESNSAKPKSFPQVVLKDHSGGESCSTCHKAHQPKVGE